VKKDPLKNRLILKNQKILQAHQPTETPLGLASRTTKEKDY